MVTALYLNGDVIRDTDIEHLAVALKQNTVGLFIIESVFIVEYRLSPSYTSQIV